MSVVAPPNRPFCGVSVLAPNNPGFGESVVELVTPPKRPGFGLSSEVAPPNRFGLGKSDFVSPPNKPVFGFSSKINVYILDNTLACFFLVL